MELTDLTAGDTLIYELGRITVRQVTHSNFGKGYILSRDKNDIAVHMTVSEMKKEGYKYIK